MEESEEKLVKRNGFVPLVDLAKNITVLDISHRNILNIEDNIELPPNLLEINIGHNNLSSIPPAVMKLTKLKHLDVSHNNIIYFDDTPEFCHSIEVLDISNNKLLSPPYWVWCEHPQNLINLNIGENYGLTQSFVNDYFEELLQHKTEVIELKISGCKLHKHLDLLKCFPKVKKLHLGTKDSCRLSASIIESIPRDGLNTCCDVEYLDLTNTFIHNICPNINMFNNLIEINLSQNYLTDLPVEFCELLNLEVCILSNNKLLYLPGDIVKLKKLVKLCVDGNNLCMIPVDICMLPCLELLDLYDNGLYEIPEDVKKLTQIDLAQNYVDEPSDDDYIEKKRMLRKKYADRFDGRKCEEDTTEFERSDCTDDERFQLDSNDGDDEVPASPRPASSPEDWDTDDYWVPHYSRQCTPPASSPWLIFVKQKMAEGNFCPMDMHLVSVAEKVKYEKLINPPVLYESDGQFDDLSGEDS